MHAQQITLEGKVKDSLGTPLAYANLLAIPQGENTKMSFAITDNNGIYTLKLNAHETYELNISYLGFQKITKEIQLQENTTQDYVMHEESGTLEEILIKHKVPITIKQDTLIYNVDSFTDGTERKLRDVLKNLPGVEVDRAGNVTVNGKKITTVLVDGKTFFTGDSKLAVNNIPADAAEAIEIIDDYHDIAMFKGLEDSDDMAMNIKLKEDKKKFVFGDIEAGGGVKNRYVLNPKLFYYSPNTNLSFIGDVNNINENAFTMQDYLQFEGGMSKLMSNPEGYFSLFNSEIARFISTQDAIENSSRFGAINFRQAISKNTDLSAYAIGAHNKTQTATVSQNQFTDPQNPFLEERTTTNQNRSFFTLGKISLQYTPSFEEELHLNSFFKISDNTASGLITTQSPFLNNHIQTRAALDAVQLRQTANYSRKLSKKHTITSEIDYNFQKDTPANQWITNQPILQGLIPLEEEEVYHILQDKRSQSHRFQAIFKDYWVLHRFHHLYTSVQIEAAFNRFFSEDYQLLNDGNNNNFNSNGFGNDFSFEAVNTALGMEYKFQKGIAVFKPAVFIHFFNWHTQQFDEKNSQNKTVLLPKFNTDINFSSSEKLTFRYAMNARLPNSTQLANRFILSSFNSVFLGNAELQNDRSHRFTLNYHKFKMFKGFRIYASTALQRRDTQFKNVTELNSIEQYNTVMLFDNPEHNWTTNFQISQVIKDIRLTANVNYTYTDFYQLLNNQESLNISKRTSGTLRATTLFKNFPRVELAYTKDFNNYASMESVNKFENDRLAASIDYAFWNDFIFKGAYNYDVYKNNNLNMTNFFDTANASLFYQKEGSPWGFELNATNIFNNTFRQQNRFSDFLITDTQTFVFPRVLLFKVAYKL
ncbi:MAG TPA: carboxypeptidase-like regulatory domain-containing protein [Flavobacteriaceae bacterium]|nr:carboxypeptidase-like regulatory domain-containing protein [Flavobacteriaceae bacterium]